MDSSFFPIYRSNEIVFFSEYVPLKASDTAAGYDLQAVEDYNIAPKMEVKIDLGIRFAMPDEYYMKLCLRSSVKGLLIPNSFGIIDSDYRGKVFLRVYNFSEYIIRIKRGERVAQGIFTKKPDVYLAKSELSEADFLLKYETKRGEGGFGSTGK